MEQLVDEFFSFRLSGPLGVATETMFEQMITTTEFFLASVKLAVIGPVADVNSLVNSEMVDIRRSKIAAVEVAAIGSGSVRLMS